MDVLVLLWVAVPAVVMVHASVCDVRSREVPDIHWAVIGASGAILSTLSVRDVCAWGAVSTMAGSLLLLAYMLSERLSGAVAVPVVAASAVLIIAPFAADPGDPFARAAVASFVTFFAMFAMYRIGLITGGADAKCLMSLSIAFPVYPESGTIPLVWVPEPSVALLMNPTVSVLVIGLVISLTSSPEEFLNSWEHEKKHLARHIEQAYGIDPYREEAAYLEGTIAQKMFPVARKFICEHCREGMRLRWM